MFYEIICCHLGGGEDPKENLDIWGGGGGNSEKNGNFQIFTYPPPPLINNERSLTLACTLFLLYKNLVYKDVKG